MSSLRFWILILATVSFLAGTAAGILLADRLQPCPADGGPLSSYESLFVQNFDITADRRHVLRQALDRYHGDVESVKARHVRDLEPELVRLGVVCRDRIREFVLEEDQRPEFDRLAAGIFPAPEAQ